MELQHFGLRHPPLGKESTELWDDGMLARLHERFQWLLQSPGVGLLTGEAGVGKTAALRALTAKLNPHRYQVIYHAETDFGRLDLYRCLAQSLGLAPSYRRALLWREIKAHIHHLADAKQLLPVWILDEAQNLPPDFFRDFPAFLNFAFDSRDLMTVWLVGHPVLAQTLPISVDKSAPGARPAVGVSHGVPVINIAPPSAGGVVYYQVTRLNTGDVASGSFTTNLPLGTVLLCHQLWRTNNATALAVGLDVAGIYMETDY